MQYKLINILQTIGLRTYRNVDCTNEFTAPEVSVVIHLEKKSICGMKNPGGISPPGFENI